MTTDKTKIGTIDLTPTWESLIPAFVTLIEEGNPASRTVAIYELQRMAKIADLYVAQSRLNKEE